VIIRAAVIIGATMIIWAAMNITRIIVMMIMMTPYQISNATLF